MLLWNAVNVKGLAIHYRGKTLKMILNTLDEIGYTVVPPQTVNAMYFGVPQHRERIYIVGFRKDLGIKPEDFSYPEQKERCRQIQTFTFDNMASSAGRMWFNSPVLIIKFQNGSNFFHPPV